MQMLLWLALGYEMGSGFARAGVCVGYCQSSVNFCRDVREVIPTCPIAASRRRTEIGTRRSGIVLP